MLHLTYVGESEKYVIAYNVISDHIVEITGDFPIKGNGFSLSRLGEEDNWDYTGYTTVYRMVNGGAQFSDDNSVYVPPVPQITFSAGAGGDLMGEVVQNANDYSDITVPTPVPAEHYAFSGWQPDIPGTGQISGNTAFQAVFQYVPTLEDVQEAKVVEMNIAQQAAIQAGINVTLTDGTVEHFTLTDHDQTSLMGLQAQVTAGEEAIPWHTSDEAEHCKFYSNADMGLITMEAMAYVTWHVTYFRDLRIYIRSLESAEAVQAIDYGTEIPAAFQSDPLKVMIAARRQE